MEFLISALKYMAAGAVTGVTIARTGWIGTTAIPLKPNDVNPQVVNHWLLPFVVAQWDTIEKRHLDDQGRVTGIDYTTNTYVSSRPLVFERT